MNCQEQHKIFSLFQFQIKNPVPVLAAGTGCFDRIPLQQKRSDGVDAMKTAAIINQHNRQYFCRSPYKCSQGMWKVFVGEFLSSLCNWVIKQTCGLWSHWSFSPALWMQHPYGDVIYWAFDHLCIICEADIMMAVPSWYLSWLSNEP